MTLKNILVAISIMAAPLFTHAITAKSWLVADNSGNTIQGENTQEVRSIASITKLMTVMVVLDAKQNLNDQIGDYTRKELIQIALVRSDNNAATKLCEFYPGGYKTCVSHMNTKAKGLGMLHTQFLDATGLNVYNLSTAEDLILLVQETRKYTEILQASRMAQVKVKIKKKWLVFRNTNPIIGRDHRVMISKTGYIGPAGGCIVMLMDTDVGKRIVIVLGSKNTRTRIPEAEFIVNKS
jgi:D-alanyl-D-alanine endopeptidase (penicillin-binding protein 7)